MTGDLIFPHYNYPVQGNIFESQRVLPYANCYKHEQLD